MIDVQLMGKLGRRFGKYWKCAGPTLRDVFQLIDCQVDGFQQYLIDCHNKNIGFGVKSVKGQQYSEEELDLPLNVEKLYISEVPAGASDSGAWFKIVVAVALIIIATVIGGPGAGGAVGYLAQGLIAVGISLAITGINELLMPKQKKEKSLEGYYFNGPVNTVKQGQPVPLLYGELRVGGAPISVSYTKRPINSAGFVYHSSNTNLSDFDAISSYSPQDLGLT